jgi:hypothetical protein
LINDFGITILLGLSFLKVADYINNANQGLKS